MGVEFDLWKVDKPEKFQLGKGSLQSCQDPLVYDTRPLIKRFCEGAPDEPHWDHDTGRGLFSWAQITKHENYDIFILPEIWERAAFDASVAFCLRFGDPELSAKVADRLWNWAGDDRLVLVPELEDSYVRKKHGIKGRKKVTGSVWGDE